MSLLEKIRSDILIARKGGKKAELSILSVWLGEIQQFELVDDVQVIRIAQKLIRSNEETLDYCRIGQEMFNRLSLENMLLMTYLPQVWNKRQIIEYLQKHKNMLQQQRSDGQAIGVAIKLLHSNDCPVNNADVSQVVLALRQPGFDTSVFDD